MNSSDVNSEVVRMVNNYKSMREMMPASSMYREAMWQYGDMANGGTGGEANDKGGNKSTIREVYYPGYPDQFFFMVLSGLGEFEKFCKTGSSPIGIP